MKYIKLKDICDVFISRPSIQKDLKENAFLITPSNLCEDNIINGVEKTSIAQNTNDKYLLRVGDILIKRLNPVFVNVFSLKLAPIYSSSNIIVVRPKKECLPEYIAAIFSSYGVESMTHYVKRGVTIQAISAKELSEIKIPLVTIEKQMKIGALWSLHQRKQILQMELQEFENLYMMSAIKMITKEEE